jgi:C4-dicarboxylate-binding protein DctP
MRNSFDRRTLLKTAGAVALMSGSRMAFAADAKIAKIGHLEAATQPRHQGLEKVSALVSERTKKAIEFKLFPASQLGNARQMIEGTQFGSLECTVMPAAFLGGFNPVISVLDIPFLLPKDRTQANALRDGPFGQYLLDSFQKRGFAAVGLWANGRKSMTSRKPLASPKDFQGQRFRVMDSKILIEQFTGVGASAVALPFGELYTALQTGVVDGEENPLDTIATMKFYEVQKYLVHSDHGAMEDFILFNPAWWNGLAADQKNTISTTFKEVRPVVEDLKEKAQKEALDKIRKGGVEVRELGDAERAEWRKLMYPPAVKAYVQRAGDEGKKAIEIYEAEAKKLGLPA